MQTACPRGAGDGRDTHVPSPGGDRLVSWCHAALEEPFLGEGGSRLVFIHPYPPAAINPPAAPRCSGCCFSL